MGQRNRRIVIAKARPRLTQDADDSDTRDPWRAPPVEEYPRIRDPHDSVIAVAIVAFFAPIAAVVYFLGWAAFIGGHRASVLFALVPGVGLTALIWGAAVWLTSGYLSASDRARRPTRVTHVLVGIAALSVSTSLLVVFGWQ